MSIFKEHPNQSLGVIAFSEAQASAIENELTILRNANTLFERFFQEGAHEEFFSSKVWRMFKVMSVTSFFLSVGYAKAADQTLHYNFGPLSKTRGERRLNVAVTRAKYHMKLISSLKPSDLSDTKSKRKYWFAFAKGLYASHYGWQVADQHDSA
ncbi:hypothetical protein ACFSQ7_10545 [Paenibacillus rhizoplanae]